MFLHASTIKKAKKMPKYDVHAKRHFFMPNHFKKRPNFWNLALKMPTWQPWYICSLYFAKISTCTWTEKHYVETHKLYKSSIQIKDICKMHVLLLPRVQEQQCQERWNGIAQSIKARSKSSYANITAGLETFLSIEKKFEEIKRNVFFALLI